ncbi:hypothetical protein [Aestuariivirga sp.]|uniref:hypothetical protein n=1 Tax=Aestuariivirga sp. TaxID=2650926 RepID=UPI0025BB556A|nr:hypothetical protein [Aestuariivirga sp.]MCA3556413.1 ABC transporter ATP-binding protein/permease [Aestuariivirga sp.]
MFSVLSLARVRGEALGCLLFVLLFQLCYSAAPVYLSRVAASSPRAEEMTTAVVVFLILYFLPYPLTYAAALFRALWRTTASRAFYEQVYRRKEGRIAEATSRQADKTFATVISATGQELMFDCITFVYDSFLLLCSSLLSVVLISLFVLKGFALAYVVSAILCAVLLWRLGPWQVRMSAAYEKSYNRLVTALPEGWLANTLGDRQAVSHFMRLFARRWRLNRRMAFASMNAFRAFDMLQAISIWAPASLVILLQLRSMTATEMVALAIVLPRLTEALLDISNLVGNAADYLALRGRADWLNRALAESPSDLGQRLDLARIRIMKKHDGGWHVLRAKTADEALAAMMDAGRYAVSGPNGSGKTTLMLLLKQRDRERAVYLPAQSFLFPSIRSGLSIGQRKLRDLQRGFSLKEAATCFLLDEWDANLDPANRQAVSSLLDDLSQTHTVIEVSHRMPP